MTKDMQTEQLLCWSGMTDTEHTTSGSNEEENDPFSLPQSHYFAVLPMQKTEGAFILQPLLTSNAGFRTSLSRFPVSGHFLLLFFT